MLFTELVILLSMNGLYYYLLPLEMFRRTSVCNQSGPEYEWGVKLDFYSLSKSMYR